MPSSPHSSGISQVHLGPLSMMTSGCTHGCSYPCASLFQDLSLYNLPNSPKAYSVTPQASETAEFAQKRKSSKESQKHGCHQGNSPLSGPSCPSVSTSYSPILPTKATLFKSTPDFCFFEKGFSV